MSASDAPEPRTHPVTGQEIPPEPSGDVLVTRGDGDILTHWHGSSWRVHGKDQVYASWSEIFLRYPFVPEISVWHRIDDPRPVYPDRAVDARLVHAMEADHGR